MDLHRIDPARDADRVREFLSSSDPDDYLLEGLDEWVREGRLYAGVEKGAWVVFARLHDLGDGEGWLSGMRVLSSRRGQGLGSEFVKGLLSEARASGLTDLRAVIEDENIASRRLVGHFGFRSAASMCLRRGLPDPTAPAVLRPAGPDDDLGGPVGWIPERTERVDLLPGTDGGRFGRWRPSLPRRWAEEGKLYLAPGIAAAVQEDWWREPRTLWVNPLRGSPAALFPAVAALTHSLGHEEWQAFLPSTDELRAEYHRLGALPHAAWGDRVQLYERSEP